MLGMQKALQERFCKDEQHADGDQGEDGHPDFLEIDLVACNHVMEPGLDVAAEYGADDHEQGAAVQEHDRQVGKAQEPCAKECMVAPEGFFCIGIHTARSGAALHQVGDAHSNDQHDYRADQQAKDNGHKR